jgi:hypothetical protein
MKKKDFPQFDESVYSKVTLSKLIVYAVHYLLERQFEIAMDDIVFACFRLFPQKFALKKYPRLPDSAVVGRHWHYCRSQRYVAANTDFGFKLTVKGERLARKTAKLLGVKISKPEVKVKPAPTKTPQKKAVAPVTVKPIQLPQAKIVEAPVKKIKVASKKKAAAPVTVKSIQPPQAKMVETPVKKTKVAPKKQAAAPVIARPIQPPQAKMVEAPVKKTKVAPKKKVTAPVIAPMQLPPAKMVETPLKKTKVAPKTKAAAPVTVKPMQLPQAKMVEAPVKKTRDAKPTPSVTAKQTQPPQPKPIWREKIIPPEPTVRTVSALPEKPSRAMQSQVSPEAKIRAGKFIRMMETSDAYVLYKRSGAKSNISEFDFRSLLLCTMETSAETLARNVEQFKGYANIHDRRDIIAFLDFCGEQFLHLLTPQKKISAQRKR